MSRNSRHYLIDFDVHHGDGTEELVRFLHGRLPRDALFFSSIHLFDGGDAAFGPFYPGGGAADGLRENIVNVPIAPLWRRVGGAPKEKAAASSRGGGASPRTLTQHGAGRLEWRAAFAQRIIPALRAFCPELLIVSSGFDGGMGDIGNSKLDANDKYHQGLDLTPQDFEWATEQLLAVSTICCPGKVVSVLEGGYGSYEFCKAEDSGFRVVRSQLAENCMAHLSALAGVNARMNT